MGNILNWNYSINNGGTWNTIPASNDSITKHFPNINTTTLFNATIKNGVCPSTISDTIKIYTAPLSIGGSVTPSATVCATSNSGTVTVTGFTGNIIRWESSLTGNAPWESIANTTSNLVYTNLNQTTWYRAVIKSGDCIEAISSSVSITVNQPSVGGLITGTQNVCANNNTGSLQLIGNTGNVTQWESSINNGASWNVLTVNTTTLSFSNLNQSTTYRALVADNICSAVYSSLYNVNVYALPIVNYTVNAGCQNKNILFTNTSTGNNLYYWDFTDGGNASIENPMHNFLNSGSYQVKLTATSSNGCVDSIRKSVIVNPNPVSNYTAADTACNFNAISFTNNSVISAGTINSYQWSFGDGSVSVNNTNPTHTFTITGNFSVSLLAISNNGCRDSVTKTVQIYPKPIAAFTTNNVCKTNAAVFNNVSTISTGGITNAWSFGDAQSSILSSPSHLYANAGNYNIILITISNHNCKDTAYKTVTINEQPALSFAASNACLTKAIAFTETIIPTVTNYTLSWDMGNGNSLYGSQPTYTYSAPGTYFVNLSLQTDSNCISHFTKYITVYALPNVAFNFNNVCSVDSVHFSNTSSVSSGTLGYMWDFGNTLQSNLTQPVTKYNLSGNYLIKLIATTNNACKDSLTKSITIYDAPIVNFTFSNVCDGFPVQFTNNASVNSGNIASSNWDFGDNTNSSLTNPIKQYLNNGTYTVSLTVTSSNGCVNNLNQTVNVYEGPTANFTFIDECLNVAIPFTNTSFISSGIFNSNWDFGDTTSSAVNSPTHLYQHAISNQVKLIIVSTNGCKDSITKFIQTYPIPIVNAGLDTTITKGFGVQLHASGANSYAWYPTNGLNNPIVNNPFANPDITTTYIVEGVDLNGCKNSDTLTIKVEDEFLVIPYNIITPDGNGKNDLWVIKNIESYPNNQIVILDEWGMKVFEKKSYQNDWNGKNLTGEILPDGTYFYILTFTDSKKSYKGFITLLRNK